MRVRDRAERVTLGERGRRTRKSLFGGVKVELLLEEKDKRVWVIKKRCKGRGAEGARA